MPVANKPGGHWGESSSDLQGPEVARDSGVWGVGHGESMNTVDLVRYIDTETARSYAQIIRALEWIVPTTPLPWTIRWFMRFERWVYGRLLDNLLDEMPAEDRAAALVHGVEAAGPETIEEN